MQLTQKIPPDQVRGMTSPFALPPRASLQPTAADGHERNAQRPDTRAQEASCCWLFLEQIRTLSQHTLTQRLPDACGLVLRALQIVTCTINNPMKRLYPFTGEGAEAQRGSVTGLKSQSQGVAENRFELRRPVTPESEH